MDLELQKKMFDDHVATLRDYGDIKIVDFQKPESNYTESDSFLRKIMTECTSLVILVN